MVIFVVVINVWLPSYVPKIFVTAENFRRLDPCLWSHLIEKKFPVYCSLLLPFYSYSILIWHFPLHEKCLYSDLFWSIFSRIRIKYGEIRSTSSYSVWMQENTDQNISDYGHFSCSVIADTKEAFVCLSTPTAACLQQSKEFSKYVPVLFFKVSKISWEI